MEHSGASQVPSGSGNAQEIRDDIAALYLEYNELCDRCDALDVRHTSALAQHDSASLALQLVHTNAESARTILVNLHKEVEEQKQRCVALQIEHDAQVQLLKQRESEFDAHECRKHELQNIILVLEDEVSTLNNDEIATQESIRARLLTLEANEQQNTQLCAETLAILEETRKKVVLCDDEYAAGLQRQQLYVAEAETVRLQNERDYNLRLASQEQHLAEIQLSLSEKIAAAADLDAEFAQTHSLCAQRQTELHAIDAACKAQEEQRDAVQQMLASHHEDAKSFAKECAGREHSLLALVTSMAGKTAVLATLEAQLARDKHECDKQQKVLDTVLLACAEAEKTFVVTQSALQIQDMEAQKNSEQCVLRESEIAQMDVAIAEKLAQIVLLDVKIQSVHDSSSEPRQDLEEMDGLVTAKIAMLDLLASQIVQIKQEHDDQQSALSDIVAACSSREAKCDAKQMYLQTQIEEAECRVREILKSGDAKQCEYDELIDNKCDEIRAYETTLREIMQVGESEEHRLTTAHSLLQQKCDEKKLELQALEDNCLLLSATTESMQALASAPQTTDKVVRAKRNTKASVCMYTTSDTAKLCEITSQDDDDTAFEQMLLSISDDVPTDASTCCGGGDIQTVHAHQEQAMISGELNLLHEKTSRAQSCYDELDARINDLRVTVDSTSLELSQSKADLEKETKDLNRLRAQGKQCLVDHQQEREKADGIMKEHSELLRETQSSIEFMTQSRQELIDSIEGLRVSRDYQVSKMQEIRCYGNTLDLAMTELRGSVHLRQSSPEFQMKIEVILDLFAKFLDWFENTFTVSLYAFTCVLHNSRVD